MPKMWTAQTAHRLICARGDVAVTCGVGERARRSGDLSCALDDSVCTLPEQSVQSGVLLTLHRESRKGPRLHAHSIKESAHRGFVRKPRFGNGRALWCGALRQCFVEQCASPAARQDLLGDGRIEPFDKRELGRPLHPIPHKRRHARPVPQRAHLSDIDSRAKLLREKCQRRALVFCEPERLTPPLHMQGEERLETRRHAR